MRQRTTEAVWVEARNHWRIRVTKDGERKPFYSSTPGRKGKLEAEAKADAWLAEVSRPKSDMLFSELTAQYLGHIRTGNGSANLKRQEATIRLYLLPRLGERKVSDLTNIDYQEAIDVLTEGREKPLSARTCGHVRATLSALWHYAGKARIAMEQPVGLTIPSTATKGKRTILQPNDLKLLFGPAMDKYFYAPHYRFLVLTGLRPGEFLGLRNEDLKGNVLTISRAVNVDGEQTLGKNENAARSLVLPKQALDALKQHQKWRKQQGIISPWLFCNSVGERCRERRLYQSWQTAAAGVGIAPCSLYELRHSFVSMCKNNVPLSSLKAVAGHSASFDTLNTYGHVVDGEMTAAADIIAATYAQILNE